jgi:diadenosine tetraphosphate (Ap4A) HIT family hydrolase
MKSQAQGPRDDLYKERFDMAQESCHNPFSAATTDRPLVALCGQRNGYVMIAPRQVIVHYDGLPDAILLAAKTWASRLEQLGAPRAYWITLSEVTPHLHIHIFPRWPEDSRTGIALFEQRDIDPQPAWTRSVQAALHQWAQDHDVELLNAITSQA